jgi:hypothetical protein
LAPLFCCRWHYLKVWKSYIVSSCYHCCSYCCFYCCYRPGTWHPAPTPLSLSYIYVFLLLIYFLKKGGAKVPTVIYFYVSFKFSVQLFLKTCDTSFFIFRCHGTLFWCHSVFNFLISCFLMKVYIFNLSLNPGARLPALLWF